MKIFTPAFGWFIGGTIIVFFGVMIMTSAEYSDPDAALWGWLLMGLGSLGCLVGVIAKGVEVGMAGVRDADAARERARADTESL
ncbi:hypothetical protein [Aeromicrobium sp. 179-A 4D2 NHS]|uniref:hypothetical protein n=1 Tax=Aeromicrobium sp. 179-A 4D2 NHS TaxID=3142375 RepID=UPI00399FD825